jgi:murein DD-endopeptidase MepM/ murein hydrolase activator NlpD
LSQPYDPPPPGRDERHHGTDFAYYNHAGRTAIAGEGVQAIMKGHVAAAIQDRLPYGNMVIIETPNEILPSEIIEALEIPTGVSIYHLYAHFDDTPLVTLGQEITCGQILGYVGQTGYIIPVPHLHLETRLGPPGISFESMAFFDLQATEEENSNYQRWRTGGEFQHFDPMGLFRIYQQEDF